MAALELLLEGGTAELTMSMVAARAGVSRQTLYRYFSDLASVLNASVEGLGDADEALRSWVLEAAEPQEQLHRCVDALVDASTQHGVSVEELLAALPPQARAGIRTHQQRTIELIEEVLAALQRETSSAYSGDPMTDAPLILGLISAATDPSRQRAHEFIDQLVQ